MNDKLDLQSPDITSLNIEKIATKSFYIATPVANYSPDWAIVLDNQKVKHIYFVAETKGSENVNDLRGIEQLKIHCAKEHFKTISNGEVKFEVLATYEKLRDIALLK